LKFKRLYGEVRMEMCGAEEFARVWFAEE